MRMDGLVEGARRPILYNFTVQCAYQTGREYQPPEDFVSPTEGMGKIFYFTHPLEAVADAQDEEEALRKKQAIYEIFCPEGSYLIQPAGTGQTKVTHYWLFNPKLLKTPQNMIVDAVRPVLSENEQLKQENMLLRHAFQELRRVVLEFNTQDLIRNGVGFAVEVTRQIQAVSTGMREEKGGLGALR